jgi:hypothetical protein
MLIWGIFYFLWDDPLFTNQGSIEKADLMDPDSIEQRRELRLTALEILYLRIGELEKSLNDWKEAAGRHCWCVRQLLDRAKISRTVLEDISIEQRVNMMDPDFSFAEWLKNYSLEQNV